MKNFSEIKFVPKGWGYEKWIVNKEEYCGKILWFAKGKKCSWHYHKLKDEVFYIRKGKLLVAYGYDEDIKKAKTLKNVEGVIVGKAIYDGDVKLEELAKEDA